MTGTRANGSGASSTLIVTLAEFGRTPQINSSLGRDHFASAWSVSLSGCGVKGGTVYGKTDDELRARYADRAEYEEIFRRCCAARRSRAIWRSAWRCN